MYAPVALKQNPLLCNIAHGIVNKGASLRGRNFAPLCCIIYMMATNPCMGSGSLLLNAKKYAAGSAYIRYYGQELMTSTYNLARMNMFLHGIVPENQILHNGDTLDGDWPTGEETNFDMVLMNPPYSAKGSAAAGFLQDERFSDYGVLAPK